MKVSDYATKGDSVSLKELDDEEFTITGVEDSDYTDGDEVKKGVKITTKESFKGENKFHTTRIAIVKFLSKPDVRKDVFEGKSLHVKIVESTSKKGKQFFELVDA